MEEQKGSHAEEIADVCARVAARLIDSITRTAQLASGTTPEMQELTSQWIELIGREVLSRSQGQDEIDIEEMARSIGISPSSLLSLFLTLQRRGRLKVTHLRCGAGEGKNEDLCSCMTED